MKCLHSLFDEKIENQDTAVTVGKFDGIHRGHNILVEKIMSKNKDGLKSCIVTFSNSPRLELQKDLAPSLITNKEREFMLESDGIDYLVECPFDDRLRETSAEDFVKILCQNLKMKYMVVGSDFRFGYKGMGDIELLKKLSKKMDFQLDVIDKIKMIDKDISSSFIREELMNGNITLVNEMLGYKYFVWGTVVHGAHLGSTIGIPTINITPPSDKLVPKFGVYVTEIEINGKIYHGVTNVGTKPTVKDNDLVNIETHILDFNENLYDRQVKVTFVDFLRPEMKFSSIEELQAQMNKDKEKARKCFNNRR